MARAVLVHKGSKNPHWKGGRYIHPSKGCVFIWVNGKYVREHRYVMEQHFGEPLKPTDEVHHVNGNKLDNRVENLQVMSRSLHRQIHAD